MTIKRLKELLTQFDDDTEVIVTGSWEYSKVVPGSVKTFEGPVSLVIDAVQMNNRVEICGKLEEIDPYKRFKRREV